MIIFTGYTLFDIPYRGDRSTLRNWNTIVQLLSLRTQPYINKFPTYIIDSLDAYKFGKNYKGQAKIWSFSFTVDHPQLFELDNDPIYHLKNDSNLIPMIDYNRYINNPCCLLTDGDSCNLYYTLSS